MELIFLFHSTLFYGKCAWSQGGLASHAELGDTAFRCPGLAMQITSIKNASCLIEEQEKGPLLRKPSRYMAEEENIFTIRSLDFTL